MKIIRRYWTEMWYSSKRHTRERFIDDVRVVEWYKNGIMHRDDGPAFISNFKHWFHEKWDMKPVSEEFYWNY